MVAGSINLSLSGGTPGLTVGAAVEAGLLALDAVLGAGGLALGPVLDAGLLAGILAIPSTDAGARWHAMPIEVTTWCSSI